MSEVLDDLYEERHARNVATASRPIPSAFKFWLWGERRKIFDAKEYVRGYNWAFRNAGKNGRNIVFLEQVVKFGQPSEVAFHLGANDALHRLKREFKLKKDMRLGFEIDG